MIKKDKEFDEVIIADNKEQATSLALKNNPETEVINVEWTFKL
tara:strand:- start:190 stop:318 length:129 start_codon:yes stop_codon:yes gene_type:complete